MNYFKQYLLKKWAIGCLIVMLAWPPPLADAQGMAVPVVGSRVALSQPYKPAMLNAVTVDPRNPFQFDFYVDDGIEPLQGDEQKRQYLLFIKDFMTALTIPEQELWVNLSPYEQDRIMDEHFALTEMGRDLLAQDYLLKQITSSLIYPEEKVGREFWAEVYHRAQEKFGTTDIPWDTFNKVWIMPDIAEVYQEGSTAMVLSSRLKVMLEADYLATSIALMPTGSCPPAGCQPIKPMNAVESDGIIPNIMREIVIPLLEKEVNEGKTFARLRQIYQTLILAAWYKKAMRGTVLNKIYVDQAKVKGIEQSDPAENLRIYNRYVEAFRVGAFNYIKDEADQYSGEVIPRKYFSGGVEGRHLSKVIDITTDRSRMDAAMNGKRPGGKKSLNNIHVVIRAEAAQRLQTDAGEAWPEEDEPEIMALASERDAISPNPLVKLYGKDWKRYESADKKLRAAVRRRMKEIIGKEKSGTEILRLFNQMVDGKEKTGLQSLTLSGGYTKNVFTHMRSLVLLARRDEPVPYEEILDGLDLNPALKGDFLRILPKLGDVKDYEKFSLMIQHLPAADIPGNLFLIEDYKAGKDILTQRRKISWSDVTYSPESVDRLMMQAKGLMFTAQSLVKYLSEITPLSTSNLEFVRVKSKTRTYAKLDKIIARGSSAVEIYDMVGGRIAVRGGLAELATAVKNSIKNSEVISRYIKNLETIQYDLLKKYAANPTYEGREELLKVEEALLNLDAGYLMRKKVVRPILVEVENHYKNMNGFYKAVHESYALGRGDWTVEIQWKTLDWAIVGDFEHYFYEDSVLKDSPVHRDVKKYLWLINAVETANYFHSLDEKYTRIKLEAYLPDNTEDIDQAQSTGGIDVRAVEDQLLVRGQLSEGGVFSDAGVDLSDLEGFFPEIIAIRAVSEIPFAGISSKGIN